MGAFPSAERAADEDLIHPMPRVLYDLIAQFTTSSTYHTPAQSPAPSRPPTPPRSQVHSRPRGRGERIVTNHLILDAIFAFSSPGTIIRVGQTCWLAYEIVASYFRVTFDINRHLSRFFPDPVAFRSLQARTGSLISGSDALQFLDRALWEGADLDLYVYRSRAWEVLQFLLDAGYQCLRPTPFVSHFRVRSDYPGPIYDVVPFVKTLDDGKELKIELISCLCPVLCVTRSHSTCTMNFISYDRAYSLFSWATFEERRSLMHTRNPERLAIAREKYIPRGWDVIRSLSDEERSDASSPFWQGYRIINRSSWIIPLNMDGIESPGYGLSRDPVFLTTWNFQSPHIGVGKKPQKPTFKKTLVQSRLLRYVYLFDHKALVQRAYDFLRHPQHWSSPKSLDALFIEHMQQARPCA